MPGAPVFTHKRENLASVVDEVVARHFDRGSVSLAIAPSAFGIPV